MRDKDTSFKRLAGAIAVQAARNAVKGDPAAREWLIEDAPALLEMAGMNVNTEQIDEITESGLPWRKVRSGKGVR
jgi:hypothetical protein